MNRRRKRAIEKAQKDMNYAYARRNKEFPFCSGCGNKLDKKDWYSMQYGFCSVSCGLTTVGMSWHDFY